ncbi:MAG: ABC transporter substrate-binding protein, partial [Pararhodobacter sp.]
AAQAAGSSYPPYQMAEGWIAGMVIEEALRQAGWPADAAALNEAMQNLEVDTMGLRGGPIVWTPENHFRTTQYYRVYQWDTESESIQVVRDWFSYTVE